MIYRNDVSWEGYKDDLKKVKPFKGGKICFKLTEYYSTMRKISKGEKGDRKTRWQRSYADNVNLPVEYSWIDKEGASCVIRYVEKPHTITSGGRTESDHRPYVISVQKGQYVISEKQMDLYWYLMNWEHNESNAKYQEAEGKSEAELRAAIESHTGAFKIRLYDPMVEAQKDKDKHHKRRVAEKMLENDLNVKELAEVYEVVAEKTSVGVEPLEIENYLADMAVSDAQKVLDAIGSESRSIIATINRAVEANILTFEDKSWVFNHEPICTVQHGKHSKQALIRWFNKKDDGGKVIKRVKDEIELTKEFVT